MLELAEDEQIYFFEKMKKGVKFINVGRGSSVDTEALIDALDKGIVSFAGLDVFEERHTNPLCNENLVKITTNKEFNIQSSNA